MKNKIVGYRALLESLNNAKDLEKSLADISKFANIWRNFDINQI